MKKITNCHMFSAVMNIVMDKYMCNNRAKTLLTEKEKQEIINFKAFLLWEIECVSNRKRENKNNIHKYLTAQHKDCMYKQQLRMMHVLYSMLCNKTYNQIEGTTYDKLSFEDIIYHFKFVSYPRYRMQRYIELTGHNVENNEQLVNEVTYLTHDIELIEEQEKHMV